MNIYFLVEGEETEMQLYPAWLAILLPQLKRVDDYRKVKENNFYLFSGGGIPSIYRHAANAIKDINALGTYNYLFVCLDSDEVSIERRKEKLLEYLQKENVSLKEGCQLEIIVHHRCVETWFLGNRKVYKRNPQGEKFRVYSQFYNVEETDPELMGKFDDFKLTSHFHYSYLKEMLAEYNIRYRKSRPGDVLQETYLQELLNRIQDSPEHLSSLKYFINSIAKIKNEMVLPII